MMLGNRQLAMLREMGVRVWQPKVLPPNEATADSVALDARLIAPATVAAPDQAAVPVAINIIATRARIGSATSIKDPENTAESGTWVLGPAHELHAPTGKQNSTRWLVLLEAASGALQGVFNPLEDDAGTLLGNMLRAAHMQASGGVTAAVAPLVRGAQTAGAASAELRRALPEQIAKWQPTAIIVMGRLAAQAALQSSEPFAKLRGRVHQLHGTPCVVTLDPAYLIRNPPDKAKAWDDLCLALSIA